MQDNSASMSNDPSRMRKPEHGEGKHKHNTRSPRHCGHFLDGHDIHHIRALRSTHDDVTWQNARNVRLVDGMIEFEVDGQTIRGWNHDEDDVAWLIATGLPAKWCAEFKLLRFSLGGNGYLLGVGKVADPEGCTSTRSDGGLIDLNSGNANEQLHQILESIQRSQETKLREARAMELLAGVSIEDFEEDDAAYQAQRATSRRLVPALHLGPKCGKSSAGHDIAHARVARALAREKWLLVDDILSGRGWAEFYCGNDEYYGWNHNAEYLDELVEGAGVIEWNPTSRLLRFACEDGWNVVSLALQADPEGCGH